MPRSWSRYSLVFALVAGCGSEITALPEDDAAVTDDTLEPPSDVETFDIQPLDRGNPSQTDTGSVPPGSDTGSVSPGSDTGVVPPGTDSGSSVTPDAGVPPSMTGVCPATCVTNDNCDSCWRLGETHVGSYCCTSGLCIYRADMCTGGTTPPPPPTGTDGGLGLDASGGGARDAGTGTRDAGGGLDAGGGTRDAGTGTRDAGTGARDVSLGRG